MKSADVPNLELSPSPDEQPLYAYYLLNLGKYFVSKLQSDKT